MKSQIANKQKHFGQDWTRLFLSKIDFDSRGGSGLIFLGSGWAQASYFGLDPPLFDIKIVLLK